jgi:hypothetical protein
MFKIINNGLEKEIFLVLVASFRPGLITLEGVEIFFEYIIFLAIVGLDPLWVIVGCCFVFANYLHVNFIK